MLYMFLKSVQQKELFGSGLYKIGEKFSYAHNMHAKQSVHRAGPGQIRRSDPMFCMFLESAQHKELVGSGL